MGKDAVRAVPIAGTAREAIRGGARRPKATAVNRAHRETATAFDPSNAALTGGEAVPSNGVVVCDHARAACVGAGCNHARAHRPGVLSLNGLDMGDCTDERREHVCCVATGTPERIRCVPAHNTVPPLVGGAS